MTCMSVYFRKEEVGPRYEVRVVAEFNDHQAQVGWMFNISGVNLKKRKEFDWMDFEESNLSDYDVNEHGIKLIKWI